MSIVTLKKNFASLAGQLERQGAPATISWAVKVFKDGLVIVTGFGPEGIVNMHMASKLDPDIKVAYIDTGLFFDETLALCAQLQKRLGLNIEAVRPKVTLDEQAENHGDRLWQRDPDLCCYLRKVEPLQRYLAGKSAWISGIRRDQTPARRRAQVVEWDATNQLVKINPLVTWTSTQVWDYIHAHDLPYNALQDIPVLAAVPAHAPWGLAKIPVLGVGLAWLKQNVVSTFLSGIEQHAKVRSIMGTHPVLVVA